MDKLSPSGNVDAWMTENFKHRYNIGANIFTIQVDDFRLLMKSSWASILLLLEHDFYFFGKRLVFYLKDEDFVWTILLGTELDTPSLGTASGLEVLESS